MDIYHWNIKMLLRWNANFNLETDAVNEQYKLMRQGLDAEATDSEYYK